MNIILSTGYFPPINYFKYFEKNNLIYIDTHEYYQRHSYRNRTNILGANNTILLTVPIKKRKSKTKTKDIKISQEKWKKNHIQSIKSAYGSAPYFIYYFDKIEQIINTNYKFLVDLNYDILQYILDELNIKQKIIFTEKYIPMNNVNYLDQRQILNTKTSIQNYQQVFSLKFIPDLSILDLIFNLGPNAKYYLNKKK